MATAKKVLIVGGGFAGLATAKALGNRAGVDVVLIDRRNFHLFQPLLYQVAMAGLNPSDIAVPLRKLLAGERNIEVLMAEVDDIDLAKQRILFDGRWMDYDYLVMACGSKHFYFGNEQWEEIAPGLKTIEQATEIRRRVLLAFERAEKETDAAKRDSLLTFAVVGGGPTGVELAGAIAELARKTLRKEYRMADLNRTRVVLIEAEAHILSVFPPGLRERARRDLEQIGVEVVLNKKASDLSKKGLLVGDQFLKTHTIIWAAGVKPAHITEQLQTAKTKDGRVLVNSDMSIPNHPNVFVLGDQSAFNGDDKKYLPALAQVAMQQGGFVGRLIRGEVKGKPRTEFKYRDKGIMATIGRSRAVVSSGRFAFAGFFAWLLWVVIHIAYLVQFKNKLFVLLQWAYSYFKFGVGARLIVHKSWKFYSGEKIPIADDDD